MGRSHRRAMTPEDVDHLCAVGRLTRLEREFLQQPWIRAKDFVEVKLLPRRGELHILALSKGRRQKGRIMRRRLKQLWNRLHEL